MGLYDPVMHVNPNQTQIIVMVAHSNRHGKIENMDECEGPIGKSAYVGNCVVLGIESKILGESIVLDGTSIRDNAGINNAKIGQNNHVGFGSLIGDGTETGNDVCFGDGVTTNHCIIGPGAEIGSNVKIDGKPGITTIIGPRVKVPANRLINAGEIIFTTEQAKSLPQAGRAT